MEIRQAKLHEASAVVMLVQALWPHHTTNELREELLQLLKRVDAAFFLPYHHECPVGMPNASCAEFASDCELDNTDSLSFHLNTGFTEAGRIICFCKML